LFQFRQPSAVVAHGGRVFVADTGNDRVQVFSATTGALIHIIGGKGQRSALPGSLCRPTGMCVDASQPGREVLYVGEAGNRRISVFSIANRGESKRDSAASIIIDMSGSLPSESNSGSGSGNASSSASGSVTHTALPAFAFLTRFACVDRYEASVDDPAYMRFDSGANELWVTDAQRHRVVVFRGY
jgi:DNA-binding beta-propeller fold protein YncE